MLLNILKMPVRFCRWIHAAFTAECHEGATQMLLDNPDMAEEINESYKAQYKAVVKMYNYFF